MNNANGTWQIALSLDEQRRIVSGSEECLYNTIKNAADLRIGTSFRHDEHIQPGSDRHELVYEVADFRVTYLLDDRWAAGVITLRQPIEVPDGFGNPPSMSFFLYNQNGQQAIARPRLYGNLRRGKPGMSDVVAPPDMPRYHVINGQDSRTNAPSHNFIYDFDRYDFHVHDGWQEMYSHDQRGHPISGSHKSLVEAFKSGAELKVSVRGLCEDLCSDGGESDIPHEVFIHLGSCYFYTEAEYLLACSHPLVRVAPAIPLVYSSNKWDFGWIMPRTDGLVARLLYDPYTLVPKNTERNHAMRWFVR